MGSSTVELSLDPIVLQNQTFTTKKNTPHVMLFQLVFFLFFFQTKCSSLFLPLDCDLCKPQLQAGSIGIDFSKQFFPFKKTSCSQKKREFLIFFSKPKFFCHLFPFRQKEKTEDEKYHTRTTLPRAIFSLFFVFQNMVARWRFYLFLETPNLL